MKPTTLLKSNPRRVLFRAPRLQLAHAQWALGELRASPRTTRWMKAKLRCEEYSVTFTEGLHVTAFCEANALLHNLRM